MAVEVKDPKCATDRDHLELQLPRGYGRLLRYSNLRRRTEVASARSLLLTTTAATHDEGRPWHSPKPTHNKTKAPS